MLAWTDKLDGLAVDVLGADHPLSLGWRVKLITTSPFASENARVPQALMDEFLEGNKFSGLHMEIPELHLCVIAINEPSGDASAKTRIAEIIAHECSHTIDGFFARAYVVEVDAELRAYYLDYLVGKLSIHFPAIYG